ncbi:MAG: PilZ domain-containing protein, partial [Candidatus Acidiferrum sp.]
MTENRVRSREASGTQNAPGAERSAASSASSTKPSGGQTARRSSRVPMVVPILLVGSGAEGRVFSEKTQTVVVSLHGAGILSRNKLYAEQVLYLREQATNREAEIRVVGEIGLQEGRYTYGVAFVDETLRFWRMDFPGGPASAEQPATLLLECSSCGQVAETANGDYEYDICAIHGGLARHCEACGVLTVWRLTQKPVGAKVGAAVDAGKALMGAPAAVELVAEPE